MNLIQYLKNGNTVLILLPLLLCIWRSGYPPWIWKRVSLESFGGILIFSNVKTNRIDLLVRQEKYIAFFLDNLKKNKYCLKVFSYFFLNFLRFFFIYLFYLSGIFQDFRIFWDFKGLFEIFDVFVFLFLINKIIYKSY